MKRTKPRWFSSNAAFFGSLGTIVSVLFLINSVNNPPKIISTFGPEKPGVVTLVIPEAIVINKPFSVNVEVDTKNQEVNATGLYLQFETDKLQVIDIDTSKSFCQFYPEKKFDNTAGTVSLACGAPHPGVSGKNNVISVEFIPKKIGVANLKVDEKSKLLLSNGKGTNILNQFPQKSLHIMNSL